MALANKLSEQDKVEIRRLRDEEGMPEYKIAARFDVAPSAIRWALGKKWDTHSGRRRRVAANE